MISSGDELTKFGICKFQIWNLEISKFGICRFQIWKKIWNLQFQISPHSEVAGGHVFWVPQFNPEAKGHPRWLAECGHKVETGESGTCLGVCKLAVPPLQGTHWGHQLLTLTMLSAPQTPVSKLLADKSPLDTFPVRGRRRLSILFTQNLIGPPALLFIAVLKDTACLSGECLQNACSCCSVAGRLLQSWAPRVSSPNLSKLCFFHASRLASRRK